MVLTVNAKQGEIIACQRDEQWILSLYDPKYGTLIETQSQQGIVYLNGLWRYLKNVQEVRGLREFCL